MLSGHPHYTLHTHTSSHPHTAHPHTQHTPTHSTPTPPHYVHTIKDPKRKEPIKFATGKGCNLQTKNHLTPLTLSVTMETNHNTAHLPWALSKEMSLAIKHTTQLRKERRHAMGDSLGDSLYNIFQGCFVRGVIVHAQLDDSLYNIQACFVRTSNYSCAVGDLVHLAFQ